MTEKRFTLYKGLDTINIMDNTKFREQIYINKSSKDMKCLVGLLNELAEENKLLLRKNGAMEEEIECLSEENEQLKQQLKEYKQPNCKKCIEYSQDGVGAYCMSEKGLLGDAWKMFPYEWDYGNAKNCKEYEE